MEPVGRADCVTWRSGCTVPAVGRLADPDTSASAEADPWLLTDADVADGADAVRRAYSDMTIAGTVILDGYGVILRVHRGELELLDGIGETRRVRRIARADATAGRIRRVLLLGDGMVTTDAAGWCAAVGVALIVAGRNGDPLLLGAPALYDHGGLRRAQALAAGTEAGMTVVRWLLDRRLADQQQVAASCLDDAGAATFIGFARTMLAQAGDVTEAMEAEMSAAGLYWEAWQRALRLTFAARDARRVPDRWRAFGGRVSPLGQAAGNRHAASPANALLNYGYRLAEIEATVCCLAMGLDPGMGLAHADRAGRPALVCDVMEVGRGLVERTVWQLTRDRTFRKADFAELRSGEVRVLAPLSHEMARALLPALRATLAPVAEHVAGMLADVAVADIRVPTALTRSRHKAARAVRGDQARGRRVAAQPASKLWACPSCGAPVDNPRHVRCPACIAADPQQGTELRGRRGAAIAARKRTQAAWDAGGGAGSFDPAAWPAIREGLSTVKLAEIIAATGLSKSFASRVRAGASRPHPSHWPAFAELAGVAEPSQEEPRA